MIPRKIGRVVQKFIIVLNLNLLGTPACLTIFPNIPPQKCQKVRPRKRTELVQHDKGLLKTPIELSNFIFPIVIARWNVVKSQT